MNKTVLEILSIIFGLNGLATLLVVEYEGRYRCIYSLFEYRLVWLALIMITIGIILFYVSSKYLIDDEPEERPKTTKHPVNCETCESAFYENWKDSEYCYGCPVYEEDRNK